jgi:probable addiction module antidote protein
MKGAVPFDKHLVSRLRSNEEFREAYLNEALNEGESGLSLLMFRNVAEALGGIAKLSKSTGLNRQNLYRALSGKRDPVFSTVESIVRGFGFKIKVEALRKARTNKEPKVYAAGEYAISMLGVAEKGSAYRAPAKSK